MFLTRNLQNIKDVKSQFNFFTIARDFIVYFYVIVTEVFREIEDAQRIQGTIYCRNKLLIHAKQ